MDNYRPISKLEEAFRKIRWSDLGPSPYGADPYANELCGETPDGYNW